MDAGVLVMESSKKKKVNLQGKKDQLVDLKRLFKVSSILRIGN